MKNAFERKLIGEFQRLRKGDCEFVVVEGVHAVKHVMRFGVEFQIAVTPNKLELLRLARMMATDADAEALAGIAQEIAVDYFAQLSPHLVRTGVIALVRKPSITQIAQLASDAPIVFIQNPRDINNVGAVVRVAAGFGAAAVVVSGTVNPWHAEAIRAGAGLQFALPIMQISNIDDENIVQIFNNRKIVACDADGKNMYNAQIARNSVLVFGTERGGITTAMKQHADKIISIPMQPQVSSLNLATSVAAVLYGCLRSS